MLRIDKHIPIPENAGKPGRRPKAAYPFSDLQVGDSFFIEGKRQTLGYWTEKTGFKFASSREDNGHRYWRIA